MTLQPYPGGYLPKASRFRFPTLGLQLLFDAPNLLRTQATGHSACAVVVADQPGPHRPADFPANEWVQACLLHSGPAPSKLTSSSALPQPWGFLGLSFRSHQCLLIGPIRHPVQVTVWSLPSDWTQINIVTEILSKVCDQ